MLPMWKENQCATLLFCLPGCHDRGRVHSQSLTENQQTGEGIMPVMTDEKKATITNHVAELAGKKGYNKSKFLAAAEHLTGISRNTLQKAYEGSTELSIETVIGLAQFFGVQFKDVLEIRQ
jgi:DNA-binding phage protein